MPTAILVDGGFFLRRVGWKFPDLDHDDPGNVAVGVTRLANWHMQLRTRPHFIDGRISGNEAKLFETSELYRIFFYDCPPLQKKVHLPVSKRSLDLSKTPTALFRLAAHEKLRQTRKVALRLGRLNELFGWKLTGNAQKRLLAEGTQFIATDDDFELDVVQKGVDMRLGMDVASLAYKKQVDQIILVASDADFVPAVKLARREGIDVVIDPMGTKPAADLVEHSDGIRDARIGAAPTGRTT